MAEARIRCEPRDRPVITQRPEATRAGLVGYRSSTMQVTVRVTPSKA